MDRYICIWYQFYAWSVFLIRKLNLSKLLSCQAFGHFWGELDLSIHWGSPTLDYCLAVYSLTASRNTLINTLHNEYWIWFTWVYKWLAESDCLQNPFFLTMQETGALINEHLKRSIPTSLLQVQRPSKTWSFTCLNSVFVWPTSVKWGHCLVGNVIYRKNTSHQTRPTCQTSLFHLEKTHSKPAGTSRTVTDERHGHRDLPLGGATDSSDRTNLTDSVGRPAGANEKRKDLKSMSRHHHEIRPLHVVFLHVKSWDVSSLYESIDHSSCSDVAVSSKRRTASLACQTNTGSSV